MNKITSVIIEGKQYVVSHLTPAQLSEFNFDVNKLQDIRVALHKYKITEVK